MVVNMSSPLLIPSHPSRHYPHRPSPLSDNLVDAEPAPSHLHPHRSSPLSSSPRSIPKPVVEPHTPPHASPPPPRRYGLGLFDRLYHNRGSWRHVYQRHHLYFQDIQKTLDKMGGGLDSAAGELLLDDDEDGDASLPELVRSGMGGGRSGLSPLSPLTIGVGGLPEPSPPSPPRPRRMGALAAVMDSTVAELSLDASSSDDDLMSPGPSPEGKDGSDEEESGGKERDVLEGMVIAGMETEMGDDVRKRVANNTVSSTITAEDDVSSSEESDVLGSSEESDEDFDIDFPSPREGFGFVQPIPMHIPLGVTPSPITTSLPTRIATPPIIDPTPDVPASPKPVMVVLPATPSVDSLPQPSLETRKGDLKSVLRVKKLLSSEERQQFRRQQAGKEKKAVRFNSRALQSVCVFKRATIPSEIHSSPRFTLEDTEEDLRPVLPELYRPSILCRNFPPSLSPLPQSKNVGVERVYLDGRTLVGIVRVRNLAFEKRVVVRYSFDLWNSVGEVVGKWHGGVLGEGGVDRFLWSVGVGACFSGEESGDIAGKRVMQFAVRYEVAGQVFWDNNDGKNYEVEFVRTRIPSPSSSSSPTTTTTPTQIPPPSLPIDIPTSSTRFKTLITPPRRPSTASTPISRKKVGPNCLSFHPSSPEADIFADMGPSSPPGYTSSYTSYARGGWTSGRYTFDSDPYLKPIPTTRKNRSVRLLNNNTENSLVTKSGGMSPSREGVSVPLTAKKVVAPAADEVPQGRVEARPLYAEDIHDTFVLRFSGVGGRGGAGWGGVERP
ncbi:hypothetical protein HDV00_002769 [Rhizophlyctis rosea]|nr:hypothetical protein HDV00_002769 [Rhizophlyctis rosea]